MSVDKAYIDFIKNLDIGNMTSESLKFSSASKYIDKITALQNGEFDVLYLNTMVEQDPLLLVIIYDESPVELKKTIFENNQNSINFYHLKTNWKNSLYMLDSRLEYEDIELSNGEVLKLWKQPVVMKAKTGKGVNTKEEYQNEYFQVESNYVKDMSVFLMLGYIREDEKLY